MSVFVSFRTKVSQTGLGQHIPYATTAGLILVWFTKDLTSRRIHFT